MRFPKTSKTSKFKKTRKTPKKHTLFQTVLPPKSVFFFVCLPVFFFDFLVFDAFSKNIQNIKNQKKTR